MTTSVEGVAQSVAALKQALRDERQWYLEAFSCIRPAILERIETARQQIADAKSPDETEKAYKAFSDAVRLFDVCETRRVALLEDLKEDEG